MLTDDNSHFGESSRASTVVIVMFGGDKIARVTKHKSRRENLHIHGDIQPINREENLVAYREEVGDNPYALDTS